MREIKFRVWDKKHRYMFELDDKDFFINNYGIYTRHCVDYQGDVYENETDNFILMQYTGLKDKNDVEIYEGDVCNGHIGRVDIAYEEPQHGTDKFESEVVFEDGAFTVVDENGDKRVLSIHGQYEWVEVIGNIHEHPNLLESK